MADALGTYSETFHQYITPKAFTAGNGGLANRTLVSAVHIVSQRQLFGAHRCVCCNREGNEESKNWESHGRLGD
jgi:hypothetical protein